MHDLDGLNHYPVNLSPTPEGYQPDLVNEIIDIMLSFANQTATVGVPIISNEVVKVYPNPVSTGNVRIEFGKTIFQGSLQLYNNAGRLIQISNIDNLDLFNLNITNLSSGVYVLSIHDSKTVVNQKIVIE